MLWIILDLESNNLTTRSGKSSTSGGGRSISARFQPSIHQKKSGEETKAWWNTSKLLFEFSSMSSLGPPIWTFSSLDVSIPSKKSRWNFSIICVSPRQVDPFCRLAGTWNSQEDSSHPTSRNHGGFLFNETYCFLANRQRRSWAENMTLQDLMARHASMLRSQVGPNITTSLRLVSAAPILSRIDYPQTIGNPMDNDKNHQISSVPCLIRSLVAL